MSPFVADGRITVASYILRGSSAAAGPRGGWMNIKISDNVVWRDLDGEIVILNLTSGVYFSVDGVGTRIWTLMSERVSTEEIVRKLMSEFDVEETQLRNDMESLFRELANQDLIEISK